jgi:hypothetical protein
MRKKVSRRRFLQEKVQRFGEFSIIDFFLLVSQFAFPSTITSVGKASKLGGQRDFL